MHSSDAENDNESFPSFRFFPVDFDFAEDLERYQTGGFHPVHLGDSYDNGRYRIVHKLGAGGFSTIWLARDKIDHRWVALKIVVANDSRSVEDKSLLTRSVASQYTDGTAFVVHQREFTINGPNGQHLCLVLPVLGPSTSELSTGFASRIQPWLALRAGHQAAKALAELHEQGLCHGDVTTANIVFALSNFDQYTEDDIKRLFGEPHCENLQIETEEAPGPEAPRYIVKSLDFLSLRENIISTDIKLIDFDQSFPDTSPPSTMLQTPVEFLAPEVAIGLEAGKASDVWALGCCIFRLRSGEGPFSGLEITSPADLLRVVIETLGDIPISWGEPLFNDEGQPIKDDAEGQPLEKYVGERQLKQLVYNIWDQPMGGMATTGKVREVHEIFTYQDHEPYHACFSDVFWKPSATKVDNVYLRGYEDETDELLKALPTIPNDEAGLLFDLLSKIFIYDPSKRITAKDMLEHPWFHMSALVDEKEERSKSLGSPLNSARPARRRKLGTEVDDSPATFDEQVTN